MNTVHIIEHPLVQHHLARLRDRDTEPAVFRELVRRLAVLLAYEATAGLTLKPAEVVTPLAPARASRLDQRIALVPILRAGLGLVDPVLDLIPGAEVWHLGLRRDAKTLQPVEYYNKLPTRDPPDVALILDPMLATGGSASAAVHVLAAWGVRHISLVSLIAAPEGVRRIQEQFPEVRIFLAALDSHLNEHGFIVPGLGDAGDRMFNACAA